MRAFFLPAVLAAGVLLLPSPNALAAAVARVELAPVDAAALLAEDSAAPIGAPLRYALVRDPGVSMERGVASAGTWTNAQDAQGAPVRRWSLTITTPGALSQDFGFEHLMLPHGARLLLVGATGAIEQGPYTDAAVNSGRRFQTAFVAGDTATLVIEVPADLERYVSFDLDRVAPAHRPVLSGGDSGGGLAKSGSCNVDVVCPQGDSFRDQINSVARYSFNGFLCTGSLINNVSGDQARYFLTANHCVETGGEAASMVLYWKYENPTCRLPGSASSGSSIPLTGNSIIQTGGADLVATRSVSDFTLVRLRNPVPTNANAFYAGWDRRDIAPPSATVIHHPQGHEKRISFDNEQLQLINQSIPGINGSSFLRIVDYELGTTEQGSSGGPLLSPEKRIIGVLSGGSASCSQPQEDDYFGRFSTSFDAGPSSATRLREWLDPTGTGAQTLEGTPSGGCTPPAATLNAPAVARAGEPVTLTLNLPAGTFRVEWDVDGDGLIDRTDAAVSGQRTLQPVYPEDSVVSVVVRVTAGTSCTTTLQQSIAIDGPRVSATVAGNAQQICGDNDSAIEPGERWRVPIALRNDGNKALTNGHAAFSPQNPATLRVETPAAPLSLAPNGITAVVQIDFAIPTTAACGSIASLLYEGAVDQTAWSVDRTSTPASFSIGNNGPCNTVTTCPAQITSIAPQSGLFVNPVRFGNGIGSSVTPQPNGNAPVFFGTWFTGNTSREPVWYTVQGAVADNASSVDIRKFTRVTQSPFVTTGTIVGSGRVVYIGPNDYLFFYNVNGKSGAERQTLSITDTSVRPDRTGVWFNPQQNGAGYLIENHVANGIPTELLIAFIYGTDNEPRWTFGARSLSAPNTVEDYFQVQCPTCPAIVDFLSTRVFAGTATASYSGITTGTLSTNLSTTSPIGLDWIRNSLPIEMFTAPRP